MLKKIQISFGSSFGDLLEKKRKHIIIIAFVLLVILFLLNYFLLQPFYSDEIIVRFQQAKVLFLNSLSPYEDDVQNYLRNAIGDLSITPTDDALDLELALPQLIYYLPFSLFNNPIWGVTLFSTLMQFAVISGLYILFKLLELKNNEKGVLLAFFLSLSSLYLIKPLSTGSTIPLAFLILVSIFSLIENKKMLFAGLLLGIIFFEVTSIPILIFIIVFGLFKNKRYEVLAWAGISSALITLATMIFDRKWLIGWLRNLYLSPQRVPFLTYPQALSMRYDFPVFQLFSVITLILTIWLIFEVWRNPYNTTLSWVWILGLGSIINYFFIIQDLDISAVMLLISQTVIIAIWHKKISKSHWFIILILLGVNTFIISVVYLLPIQIQKESLFDIFMFSSSFFQVINLYWLKRWAVIPYDYENLPLDY